MRLSFAALALLGLLAKAAPAPAIQEHRATAPWLPPFRLMGNGYLKLREAQAKSVVDIRYRDALGNYDTAALRRIRHLFRSHSDQREGDISLRLVELLGFVQDHFHPSAMTLVSGYRSPQHNAGIRAAGAQAAKASLHTEGLAADVKLSGINLSELWLQLRELRVGGVGYYRSGAFLHIDTGPPRFWEESTSRVSEDLSGGNARVFARTEFDRYADLVGASLKLHSVTAFPLRVAKRATWDGSPGASVQLAAGVGTKQNGDCIEIAAYAPAYVLHITDAPANGRGRLLLHTCEPRVGKTPPEIESNPVEVGL